VALPDLAERVEAALGPKPEPSMPGHRVGRGVACNLQPYGRCVWLNDWSSAWVGFELDGTLVLRIGVPDIGGGQASSLVQLAAEVLGVDPAGMPGRARRPGAGACSPTSPTGATPSISRPIPRPGVSTCCATSRLTTSAARSTRKASKARSRARW